MTSVNIAGPVGGQSYKSSLFQEPQKSKGKLQRATIKGRRVASEAKTMSHHCNGCGKPEHNQNCLQCKQCKSGILTRSYVRLLMSYPSQVNLKVRVTVRTIRSILVT